MSRKQHSLFLLLFSLTSVLVLTALQLRAQSLLTESFRVKEAISNESSSFNRRMQERYSTTLRPLRYLALVANHHEQHEHDNANNNHHDDDSFYASQVADRFHATVTRRAIQSPALVAACTQTMVPPETEFDVISIEFAVFDESYQVLVRRLRLRFPNALILLVQIWNPHRLIHREAMMNETVVLDWQGWKRKNLDNKHDDAVFSSAKQLAAAMTRHGHDQWSFFVSEHEERELEAVARDIKAQVVKLRAAAGNETTFTSHKRLESYLSLFQKYSSPGVSLSAAGHAAVAKQISSAVRAFNFKINPDSAAEVTGSWGSGDQCNLWYDSGNYQGVVVARGTQRIDFGHVGRSHKHAMEFRRHNLDDSLTVHNPFDTERMLFLTYMTANDDGIYPKTRVKLNGVPTVQIDPFHEVADQTEMHVARTTAVGKIKPGTSTCVQLDPLQQSQFSFRLVGASLFAEEMNDIPVEFALELESVQQQPNHHEHIRFWRFW